MNTTATLITEITDAAERFARAAWAMITEPGDAGAGKIVQTLGHRNALELLRRDPGMLEAVAPDAGVTDWSRRLRDAAIHDALRDAERSGVTLIDPATVPGMTDLGEEIPHLLWVRGDVQALAAPRRVTVSGARAATSYGCHVASTIGAELAADGVSVHGGLSYGIDGEVHRATLAAGGNTVAWLASGIDRSHPAGHSNLAELIARSPGSAVVAELAPGAVPTRWRFLGRARVLSAATLATVIVEAGWRSGAIHLAGRACMLGRPVGAVPGSTLSPASAGCHRLIQDGIARLVTGTPDILGMIAE